MTFTPADARDYNSPALTTVYINLKQELTASWLFGSTRLDNKDLSRDSAADEIKSRASYSSLNGWPICFSFYAKTLPMGVLAFISAGLSTSIAYPIKRTHADVWAKIAALGLCPDFGFQIALQISGGLSGQMLMLATP